MNHRPTFDWIVVRFEKETGTMAKVNGIWQPPTQLNPEYKPKKYGTVLAVGPGRVYPGTATIAPMPCAVGETVMCNPVAGTAVVVGDEGLHWCIPDEILAVVDPAEPLA